jgi:hypothetical protein
MAKPGIKIISDNSQAMSREEQLPVILSITTEMLKKAKDNDWESVIALESQRNALIADFFAAPVATEEVQMVAHHINKVLEIDRQLLDLCSGQRENLRGDLQKVAHGKNALKVYSSV